MPAVAQKDSIFPNRSLPSPINQGSINKDGMESERDINTILSLLARTDAQSMDRESQPLPAFSSLFNLGKWEQAKFYKGYLSNNDLVVSKPIPAHTKKRNMKKVDYASSDRDHDDDDKSNFHIRKKVPSC